MVPEILELQVPGGDLREPLVFLCKTEFQVGLRAPPQLIAVVAQLDQEQDLGNEYHHDAENCHVELHAGKAHKSARRCEVLEYCTHLFERLCKQA